MEEITAMLSSGYGGHVGPVTPLLMSMLIVVGVWMGEW